MAHCRYDAERNSNQEGEKQCCESEKERLRNGFQHHIEGRPAVGEGSAELALRCSDDEANVLLAERMVQPPENSILLDDVGRGLGRQHDGDRISGKAKNDEDRTDADEQGDK